MLLLLQQPSPSPLRPVSRGFRSSLPEWPAALPPCRVAAELDTNYIVRYEEEAAISVFRPETDLGGVMRGGVRGRARGDPYSLHSLSVPTEEQRCPGAARLTRVC